MIQISNITKHQHNLLTQMWTFDTEEEFELWHNSLGPVDYDTVIGLKELVIIEAREEEMVDEYKLHATSVLNKIMYSES